MIKVGSVVKVIKDTQVKDSTLKAGEMLKVIKIAKYSGNITLVKYNENKRYKIGRNVLITNFSIE